MFVINVGAKEKMIVKVSKEFNTIQEAVEFMNGLKDPLCSYCVPNTRSYESGTLVRTSYYAVYYEGEV